MSNAVPDGARRGVRAWSVCLAALVAAGAAAWGAAAARSPGPAAPGRTSGGDPPGAVAAVRVAAASALRGTARLRMTLRGTTAFGHSATVDAAGAFDFAASSGSISLVPRDGPDQAAIVFAPNAVFIRPIAAQALLPAGRAWIEADLADAPVVTRNFPELIAQAEGVNPSLALAELAWGTIEAARSDPETIGGSPAIAYDVTVDLARALAGAGGAVALPLALVLQAEAPGLVTPGTRPPASAGATARARVWLAPDGGLAGAALLRPGTGLGVLTLTLGSFGTRVVSRPPPDDQVANATGLGPLGERENAGGGDADGA